MWKIVQRKAKLKNKKSKSMHNWFSFFLWFSFSFIFICVYIIYINCNYHTCPPRPESNHPRPYPDLESELRSRRDTHIATNRGERGSSAAGLNICSLWCLFVLFVLFGTLLRTTATGICPLLNAQNLTRHVIFTNILCSLSWFRGFSLFFIQYDFKLSTTR